MSYLTRDDALFALKKMKTFHKALKNLMTENGFDLCEDLGRRNILLSSAQEKYFCDALSRKYDVSNDGRTGEPDIVVNSLGRELECKLTSRHKSGAISFQTDYETLSKKGKLDYLYVIADKDFENFAAIHYADLEISDFRNLSTGSRGKTQMIKHKTACKANVLIGNMKNINESQLKKLSERLSKANTEAQKTKIKKSIQYWTETPAKYRFELEGLND